MRGYQGYEFNRETPTVFDTAFYNELADDLDYWVEGGLSLFIRNLAARVPVRLSQSDAKQELVVSFTFDNREVYASTNIRGSTWCGLTEQDVSEFSKVMSAHLLSKLGYLKELEANALVDDRRTVSVRDLLLDPANEGEAYYTQKYTGGIRMLKWSGGKPSNVHDRVEAPMLKAEMSRFVTYAEKIKHMLRTKVTKIDADEMNAFYNDELVGALS